jgi:hypothetical protein
MKKFNLSEKLVKIDNSLMIFDTDIIESIKLLKEKLNDPTFLFSINSESPLEVQKRIYKIINEIVGKKLL